MVRGGWVLFYNLLVQFLCDVCGLGGVSGFTLVGGCSMILSLGDFFDNVASN